MEMETIHRVVFHSDNYVVLRCDLRPVFKSELYIIFAVNRGEVHEAEPEPLVKFGYQPVLPDEFGDEGLHQFPVGFFI